MPTKIDKYDAAVILPLVESAIERAEQTKKEWEELRPDLAHCNDVYDVALRYYRDAADKLRAIIDES